MQFTLETANHAKQVSNYGTGFFDINERRFESSLCLHNNELHENWLHPEPAELTLADFTSVLEARPEILILGTGRDLIFPPAALMADLHKQGIVLETMNSSAACGTYNILVSERRRVAAALMLIK